MHNLVIAMTITRQKINTISVSRYFRKLEIGNGTVGIPFFDVEDKTEIESPISIPFPDFKGSFELSFRRS